MKTFEVGERYAVTKMGYKSKEEAVEITRRSPKMITVERVFRGEYGYIRETERYKIHGTGSGNEHLMIFGGLVSDTVYASDKI